MMVAVDSESPSDKFGKAEVRNMTDIGFASRNDRRAAACLPTVQLQLGSLAFA